MNDMITTRDDILSHLVSLRNRYREISGLQAERLDAIAIGHVPDEIAVDVERVVMVEEASVIEEFARVVEGFPAYLGEPARTVSAPQAKQSWFPLRRQADVLVEEEDPSAAEARLQDSRLLHIVNSLSEDLSERRASLQHASYTVKRVVVGLNQSAAYAISEDGTRKIVRERHRLETLVSLVERTISEIVVASRRIGMLAESPDAAAEKRAPDQLRLAG
ncbi:hypothetical protein OIU34_18225 [Pararhizobium sp. BT-229]|uniref:hypothetical protein n=1 Tax=Pararhizobium sp. BT-229 TaxID=2986923 RepID=UPI0021F6E1CF|nr:hypothetical protein [Pararhizobium sp. BT-229]MCV9963817.1 hypothetical protein [Pararhizobium sp. BT-229]